MSVFWKAIWFVYSWYRQRVYTLETNTVNTKENILYIYLKRCFYRFQWKRDIILQTRRYHLSKCYPRVYMLHKRIILTSLYRPSVCRYGRHASANIKREMNFAGTIRIWCFAGFIGERGGPLSRDPWRRRAYVTIMWSTTKYKRRTPGPTRTELQRAPADWRVESF